MNRKGSHVGMIISFVVFITFIVFMYAAIEPVTKVQKEKQSLLDYLEVELSSYLTKDLTTVTFIVNDGTDIKTETQCLRLKNPDPQLSSLNSIAFDRLDNQLNVQKERNSFLVSDNNIKFFKVFYSEEKFASSNPLNCVEDTIQDLTLDTDYSIGTFRTKEHLFNTTISDFINSYNNGEYESFKSQFSIPSGSGFGLRFTDKDGNELETEEADLGTVNVYADEKAIEYVDSKGQVQPGFLSFRVW